MKNWEMLISEAKPPDCMKLVSRVIHDRGWGHHGGLLFSDFLSLAGARDKVLPIKPKTLKDRV